MEERRVVAAVDLGSNSFHLVIGRVDLGRIQVVDTLKEHVRLGLGLQKDGSLARAAQDRALEALARMEQRLRGISPENIRAVGTNTLRATKNPQTFLAEIEATLGVPVEVIGGREEARLIYLGVALDLPQSFRRNLVVDIGGGSTEFIVGQNMEPIATESRPMGCVSFNRRFFADGRFSSKRLNLALLEAGVELERYQHLFERDRWDLAIGTSGTIKAVGRIIAAMDSSQKGITMDGLNTIRDHLIKVKNIKNHQLQGLSKDREPVFLGGFAILYGVFRELEIEEMTVSHQGLREGVLYDLVGREYQQDKRRETVKRLKAFYGVDRRQAKRVKKSVLDLLPIFKPYITHRLDLARNALRWAADLHEIGLAVSHNGYHKHGAYMIEFGDMDGFSRMEQGLIAFLVANHRKRLKEKQLPYESSLDWPMVFCLRLACIMNRDRQDKLLPEIDVIWRKNTIALEIPQKWLEEHPLTRYDLSNERDYWKKLGYQMDIR